MKLKTLKTIYWSVTGLFCAFMFYSAITGLTVNKISVDMMAALGYPAYVLVIISIAKFMGVFAILQDKIMALKEWAYAGFTIDILGAAASFYYTGAGIAMTGFVLVFLVVLFASYFLWKKTLSSKV